MIRYIYAFFIGILLALFIGTGISVFYTAPKQPDYPTMYERTIQAEPTATEKQQEKKYQDEMKTYDENMKQYNRNVSIIAIVSAVIVLVISLVFSEKLAIVADGLLLGGIFTLLYGVGRGLFTDDNKFRFGVVGVGLVVAIVLGYMKFAKQLEVKKK